MVGSLVGAASTNSACFYWYSPLRTLPPTKHTQAARHGLYTSLCISSPIKNTSSEYGRIESNDSKAFLTLHLRLNTLSYQGMNPSASEVPSKVALREASKEPNPVARRFLRLLAKESAIGMEELRDDVFFFVN